MLLSLPIYLDLEAGKGSASFSQQFDEIVRAVGFDDELRRQCGELTTKLVSSISGLTLNSALKSVTLLAEGFKDEADL